VKIFQQTLRRLAIDVKRYVIECRRSVIVQIEITNDVAFLLPLMLAVMMAKWIGDYITHPLYHSLLELYCIPFLDSEPIVYDEHHVL